MSVPPTAGRRDVEAPGGRLSRRSLLALAAAGVVSAVGGRARAAPSGAPLEEIASSDRSWVQVAVSPDGRLFVNHSRWFGEPALAVAEVDPRSGSLRPYPSAELSAGDPSLPASARAVAVQSVTLDPSGRSLWIVDAGNPQLTGAVEGGAKLVEVNLATDRVLRTVPLGADVAPPGSYLADVRIDPRRGFAFLPDLARGAIAVVDLATGRGRRVLEGHRSTLAEDITVAVEGRPWLYPDGSRPRTACTSVALSPDGRTLYYKALVGHTLYRVPTEVLVRRPGNAAGAVREAVVAHPIDAIAFGPDGRLYLTAIDRHSITRWRPGDGAIETVVRDPRLAWPVGLAFDRRGYAYTTVGRIHEGGEPADRYRLYRFAPY